MPTLKRRQDGCYIVRHCRGEESSTWQVTAEGVLFLQRRRVTEGAALSVGLLTLLRTNNWVYTGDRPRPQAPERQVEEGDLPPAELCDAIRRFHAALRCGDASSAKALTWTPDAGEDCDPPRENEHRESVQIESWKRRDCSLSQLNTESRDALGGVEYVATVTIGFRLRGPGLADTAVVHQA